MAASTVALWSCGLFFLTGLLTGVWKYIQIRGSEKARAHYYVDVAYRASLMYAFACLVLERFASLSVSSYSAVGPAPCWRSGCFGTRPARGLFR